MNTHTENPLLQAWNVPPFHLIKEEHYIPAFEYSIAQARQELDLIAHNSETPTFANTIAAIDRSGVMYNRVANVFFNLLEAEATPGLQQIAEQVMPLTVEYANYYNLYTALFERVKYVYEHADRAMLTVEERTLLDHTYKNYVRNGIMLSGADKEEYKRLTRELSDITLQYKNNALSATTDYALYFAPENKEKLQGLPHSELVLAAERAKAKGYNSGWLFDLSMPCYTAFMKYVAHRHSRQELYMAYNARALGGACDNRECIRKIVNIRLQIARLLGYNTYADYVLENRMATTSKEVNEFLAGLNKAFKPLAGQDCMQVQQYAHAHGLQGELQAWDWAYYSNGCQTENLNFDEQQLKPYFSLQQVQQGVFALAGKLYGLYFRQDSTLPVYAKDVQVWNVYEADHRMLAKLYMDFFPRDTKRNGAWMTSFTDTCKDEKGSRVLPVISLVFNFTPPAADTPSLLTYKEVTTFLHEFGHALHGMLSQNAYVGLSGTSVKRDFVELPSQIMENWACEQEFLQLFARHYITGELLPQEWVKKIKMIDNYCAGYYSVRQFNFGVLDMAWHSITAPFNGDVEVFEQQATANTQLLTRVEHTCISTAFTHIFGGGYAAGYYGYKWAEVLAADAYEEFAREGVFSAAVADRFRKHILEKGGAEHPMDLYIRFKGRKPDVNALLRKSMNNKE